MIDYYLTSPALTSCIIDYRVIDNSVNLSDHLPIAIMLQLDNSKNAAIDSDVRCDAGCNQGRNVKCLTRLRWDHGDLAGYYEETRLLVTPVFNELIIIIIIIIIIIGLKSVFPCLHGLDCCPQQPFVVSCTKRNF